MARTQTSDRGSTEVLGTILFLLVAVAVTWTLDAPWLATLWLCVGAVFARGALLLAKQAGAHGESEIVQTTLFAVGDVARWSSVGLALVWLEQVGATLWGRAVEPSVLLSAELTVARVRQALAVILNPLVFVLVLASCLLLVWSGTVTRAVSGAVAVRRPVSRLAIVLTVLNTFTFFSAQAERAGERCWIAMPRARIGALLSSEEASRRNLVASAYVARRIETLSASDSSALTAFLSTAAHDPNSDDLIRRDAARLAQAVSPLVNRTKDPPAADGGAASGEGGAEPPGVGVQRCIDWYGDATNPIPLASDIEQLDSATQELERESTTAVIEVTKLALGAVVPKDIDPLVRPFVKAVVGSVAKVMLDAPVSDAIRDWRSARDFVVTQADGTRSASNWSWGTHLVTQATPRRARKVKTAWVRPQAPDSLPAATKSAPDDHDIEQGDAPQRPEPIRPQIPETHFAAPTVVTVPGPPFNPAPFATSNPVTLPQIAPLRPPGEPMGPRFML